MVKEEVLYQADPESLAQHEAPDWWRDAKFGIMIHWGAFAVPAFAPVEDSFYAFAEWYWFYQQAQTSELKAVFESVTGDETPQREHHRNQFGEDVTYDDLIDQWKAEHWDPAGWIRLFEEAGAGYFVLVAKHHDGLALWPTATSDRHSGLMGPRRDIVGDLFDAARGSRVKPGLFYAMAEWFNPASRSGLIADPEDPLFNLAFNQPREACNAYTGEQVPYSGYRPINDYAKYHVIPQLTELVQRYQPSIMWYDLPGDPDYFQSLQVLADFYNGAEDPAEVVANDRAGLGVHGDFHTYEDGHQGNKAQKGRPFEACRSVGTSFGFNAQEQLADYADAATLIQALVETVAKGGNLLLNVGPQADGTIPPVQAERLREIGRWLDVNRSAIQGSRPWRTPSAGGVWFTVSSDGYLNVIVPAGNGSEVTIPLELPLPDGAAELLGSGPVNVVGRDGETVIELPEDSTEPQVVRLGLVTD